MVNCSNPRSQESEGRRAPRSGEARDGLGGPAARFEGVPRFANGTASPTSAAVPSNGRVQTPVRITAGCLVSRFAPAGTWPRYNEPAGGAGLPWEAQGLLGREPRLGSR